MFVLVSEHAQFCKTMHLLKQKTVNCFENGLFLLLYLKGKYKCCRFPTKNYSYH